jgi:6-phosphofructokinase 1
MVKKLGIFTSGGDAPGMNACVRAVVRSCAHYGIECIGFQNGYEGLIDAKYLKLRPESVSGIINQGGTFLGSSRSQRFRTLEGREKAKEVVGSLGVDALIGIGGDGTYHGLIEFTKISPVQIIGIPGTIDNDINGTDYTIGFDTAVNTAIEAIDKIRDTASSHKRLFFVEVMGRYAGHIALAAGVGGGAEAILIPEEKTHLDKLIERLQKGWNRKKRSMLVVVAEGDDAGDAFTIAEYVKKQDLGYEIKVTVLGHIQRGGSPSAFDRLLATRFGHMAVEQLRAGASHQMTAMLKGEYVMTKLTDVFEGKKKLDIDFLDALDITSS